MKERKIIGLIAADPHGLIGKGQELPWNYPEETEYFRRTTAGQVMIMGRKTYEATPQSAMAAAYLNIVFSRERPQGPVALHTTFVSSLEEFFDIVDRIPSDKMCFMIGGGELAKLFFKHELMEEFLLTTIHKTYVGDAFLDISPLKNWASKVITTTPNYTIRLYQRPF